MEHFALIKTMEKEIFTLKELCQALEVSRSSHYAHGQKPEGRRRRLDADLNQQIETAFAESRRIYRPHRLWDALNREGRP